MITYVFGDIFQSPAKVLVNDVNTVGVMGKGAAYDFKRFYPDMFASYRKLCEQDAFDIGQLMLHKSPHKWVLNLPTRKHFRAAPKLDYIEAGLKKFAVNHANQGVTSASFPMLGGGSGGLDWDSEVRPLMEAYLEPLPISIYIHRYDPDKRDDPLMPERRNIRAIRSWLEQTPRHVSFDKFWRDLSRMLATGYSGKTLDKPAVKFTARVDEAGKRKRRRNLLIRHDGAPKQIFISENLLVDLWGYIQRAGYVMPQNLPGGLEIHAPYLVSTLGQLDYLSPIHLAPVGTEKVIGLHFIPPSDRDYKPQIITLEQT